MELFLIDRESRKCSLCMDSRPEPLPQGAETDHSHDYKVQTINLDAGSKWAPLLQHLFTPSGSQNSRTQERLRLLGKNVLWCVVCGVWCVLCGVWCVLCTVCSDVLCAVVCGVLWCVVCGACCLLWSCGAVCGVLCAVCCVLCAVWCVLFAVSAVCAV
jgi:hypothetical protein